MGPIIYVKEPPLAIISLNRPERLNAIDDGLYRAFEEALADFNADPGMKAAILTGEGGRAFSAGADLREARQPDEYGNPLEGMGGSRRMLEPFTLKPLIAAVQGYCVGHGIDWAMHCDCIVAADDSLFGLPEIKVSVTAGFVWDNIIHLGRAGEGMRMLLAGDPISAAEAHRLGLAQWVVPKDQVMAKARAVALDFCQIETPETAKIKRVAYFWRNLMLEEAAQLGFAWTDMLRQGRRTRPKEQPPKENPPKEHPN